MNKLKHLILHPLLFAAYPVLALLANNLGESRISNGVRALVLTFLAAIVLLFVLFVFFRNWYKAAILCTITLILIFSYGQIYNVLEDSSLFAGTLRRHRILFPIYGVIFLVAIWWVAKKIKNINQVTEIFNIIGIVAVAIPVFQIAAFQISSAQLWGDDSKTTASDVDSPENSDVALLPDVYYIVLDAYARGDTMQEFYGFENDPFLHQLEEIGFYVADCSHSNYAKTRLSIASTLNMNYLETFDEIAQDLERGKESRIRMGQLIKQNAVREQFQDLGYTIVAFETGYLWSEWEKADIYLSQDSESTFDSVLLFGRPQ